jgi:hypothetical protein
MVDQIKRHSAGGKSSFALPSGMRGSARFYGERGEYRVTLTRHWGDAVGPYALWVGMNPSTAEAEINDPTICREIGFTKRLGLTDYFKVNVCDYRATNPKDLIGVSARSPENLAAIRDAAADAHIVIMAFGKLPAPVAYLAAETVAALRHDGCEMWCLGRNRDGSPKHPLYLAADTKLEIFK